MKLEEVLRERGVRFVGVGEHHHAREGWLQLDCPFCSPGSRRFRMGYSLRGGFFNCWKCGPHSRLDTVGELLNLAPDKARAFLRGLEGPREGGFQRDSSASRKEFVRPRGVGPLLRPHRDYLRSRGFDPDAIVERWKVGGIGISAHLGWRLYLPIHFHGREVSWTTRAIRAAARVRYISASEEQEAMPHKHLLYGEDFCRYAVCVCEGPISGWAIGPGAGATCGTGYTREQLLRISRYPIRGICFDSEPEAQRRARELANSLAVFPGKTYNFVLDEKDPAEASPKELRLIRQTLGL